MKLTVKTLKGGKFQIEVEESNTVAEVKGIIENEKSEMPAASCKLIHSGKVLKDSDTLAARGVKENDFLVIMVTKAKTAKAPAAAAAASTPAPAAAASTPAPATTTTATSTPAPATTSTPAAPARDEFPAEVIANLSVMGFPEDMVRHCLRAAQGNPDVAMEFLTNGIPDAVTQAMSAGGSGGGASTPAATPSQSSSAAGGQPLQTLRNHPQFGALRRLVQSNPAMLQQVLTQIGQQDPQLLTEINANQALFLEMMNEPVNETATGGGATSAPVPAAPTQQQQPAAPPRGMMEGMGNPAQMAQMIQSMSPDEVQQMAQMMGLSPEQLRASAQMIGQMPPEQLQQFMMQAMGGGGPMMMGGPGGDMVGPQVLRLTEEEMAAVDRLTEMGFDRSEAAQAFLACDKNEALAANLLMDSMGEGGGALFGGGGGNGGSGNGGGNDNAGDQDEDMYD